MPSIEKHIQLNLKRTGNGYREVHKWLEGNGISHRDRVARAEITLPLNAVKLSECMPNMGEHWGLPCKSAYRADVLN